MGVNIAEPNSHKPRKPTDTNLAVNTQELITKPEPVSEMRTYRKIKLTKVAPSNHSVMKKKEKRYRFSDKDIKLLVKKHLLGTAT